jgi:beta-lactamase class D
MLAICAALLLQDLYRAAGATGAALVTDVRDGAVVASLDADRRLLPLSTIKLYLAAVWWDRGQPGSLDDMLVDGRDQPGKDRAVELRKKFGGAAILEDLGRYGLTLSLKPGASDAEWGETLSIGEKNVFVTLPQLSAFLRKIADSPSESARKLRNAMLACVERGTARGARQAAPRLGGKTGTGPAAAKPAFDGIFAGLVFVKGEPRYTVIVQADGKGLGGGVAASIAARVARSLSPASCFLLTDMNGRETAREGDLCATRLSPASTFKIPHALAALDSGIAAGPGEKFAYDGSPQPFESWRRDQTLASAIRNSVVWVFQRIAQKLGPGREQEYLRKLSYGNADPSSGLTTFWLDGSLAVSPEEERDFLLRLYRNELPVKREAMEAVRTMLVQPDGAVVNAAGSHPFPANVSAKTGSIGGVRWLVGRVRKGERAWVFVSAVQGADDLDPNAAIDLAARSLPAVTR